jgi:hypothetical protein
MKKAGIVYFVSVFCFFASAAGASTADSLYSLAQKLYSKGEFAEAARVYGSACPQLDIKEVPTCLFKEVRALAESKKIDAVKAAEEKLMQLLSKAEPSDSLFTELNAEAAKLQIMLKQSAGAVRSWNAAQASASSDYFPELFVLCKDIVSAFPNAGLTSEHCNKAKPADSNFVSLQRKAIVPLGKSPPAAASNASSQPSQKWYVQLGAFSSKENAEKLVADFKQKGVPLLIVEIPDKKLFAVRSKTFANAEEANVFAEQKIKPAYENYKVFQN